MEPCDAGTRCEQVYAGTVLIDQLKDIVDSNFYITGGLCNAPVNVFHGPPPLPRGIAVELILREINSTCISLPHGGQFLINSTAPMKDICRQSHCPLEIFWGNFHCYCTCPMLVWGNILINSTTFPRIAAWWGTLFLRVSPAQCVVGMSKSHRTFTAPQWRKMNQFSSFPLYFHCPFPGIPGGGGAVEYIDWCIKTWILRSPQTFLTSILS